MTHRDLLKLIGQRWSMLTDIDSNAYYRIIFNSYDNDTSEMCFFNFPDSRETSVFQFLSDLNRDFNLHLYLSNVQIIRIN
jgi:hypothetical protein